MKMKRLLAASALCAMTLALAACGGKKEAAKSGGAWKPEKDIHVIVAYKAGSGTDTGARILCKDAEKHIGKTLIVDNKPGADGKIGWTELSKAKPDGYTIGYINLPTYTTLALRQGEVDFSCAKVGDVEPLIGGASPVLRVLGVYSEKRLDNLKDVPTLGEWAITTSGMVRPARLWLQKGRRIISSTIMSISSRLS